MNIKELRDCLLNGQGDNQILPKAFLKHFSDYCLERERSLLVSCTETIVASQEDRSIIVSKLMEYKSLTPQKLVTEFLKSNKESVQKVLTRGESC